MKVRKKHNHQDGEIYMSTARKKEHVYDTNVSLKK